jgi:hypothetical protein
MDRRNFFKELDKRMADLARAHEQAAAAKAAKTEFAERAVVDILPIAVRYKDDLRARGFEAQLSGNADGLTFQLEYADGSPRALTMYPLSGANRIAFITYTPGDKRTHAAGKDGLTYDPDNWSPSVFEERLQRFIDSFLDGAKRHGGVHRHR